MASVLQGLAKLALYPFQVIGLTEQELQEAPTVMWDGHPIGALAFEGGGTKGVVYGGALSRLEEAGLTDGIKCAAGTSAGAQSAALFAFGYTGAEMVEVLGAAPWDKLFDDTFGCFRDVRRLTSKFGLYKGEVLQAFIDEKLASKCGFKNCTFAQAFARTGVHLKIGVVSVRERKAKLLDHLNMPDMPVALAVHASSAIPGMFTAVEYGGDRFVDGFLLDNLPCDAFPGKKTLAFDLTSNDDIKELSEATLGVASNLPHGMLHHFGALLTILIANANAKTKGDRDSAVLKLNHAASHPRILQRATCARSPNMIDFVPILTGTAATLNTKLDAEMIEVMVAVGYVAVDKYIGKATLNRSALW